MLQFDSQHVQSFYKNSSMVDMQWNLPFTISGYGEVHCGNPGVAVGHCRKPKMKWGCGHTIQAWTVKSQGGTSVGNRGYLSNSEKCVINKGVGIFPDPLSWAFGVVVNTPSSALVVFCMGTGNPQVFGRF